MERETWQNRAADALEWKRFLSFAEDEARSLPGKLLVRGLGFPENWAPDPNTANLRQHETQEAAAVLNKDALWGPLADLADPHELLTNLERGAVLDVTELAFLRRWLYALDSWSQVPRDEIPGDLFKKALHNLPDPFEQLRIIEKILTPDGELSERASPKLAALHSEIRALKREIDTTLDHLVRSFAQKGVLQDTYTDVRDGRYVIPVKISAQSEVEGIIYEASVSRQTVFVEPKEISPLNNRLRQRQNDLIQEVFAILDATSKLLHPFCAEIRLSVSIVSHWDAVQARARAGLHYSGKPVHVTEERSLLLPQTAHPLLWRSMSPDSVIRNNIDFGPPSRAFLITGPNTGGKTVLLKTIGLAGLCARTGFPFPGTDHISIPFFDSFFADLGDPQSIEDHLSSFSGHILRFKEILEQMTPQSLVLIDELNTATDPEEGAALGRAFLETVMSRGAVVITTTHDPQLKAMAVSDLRILNGSMEFDETSRTPTFALALGMPGRSRALETAERLGMPADLLTLARSYLSSEHQEFERLLSKLESDSLEAARARKQTVALREEAERLKKEWTERTEAAANDMLERTRQRLRRIIDQAQDEARISVKKLAELRTRQEVESARTRLEESLSDAATRIETALSEEAPEIADALAKRKEPEIAAAEQSRLAVGAPVRVPKWKSTGTILELSGNRAKVAMGTIQISLSMQEIEPLLKSELAQLESAKQVQQRREAQVHVPPAPSSQLDLRGQRLDEAMAALEQYLDQAFRSGALAEVTIIHGLGTGALREGARKLLRSLPYVKEFRDGGVGLGGAGATIVEFDRG